MVFNFWSGVYIRYILPTMYNRKLSMFIVFDRKVYNIGN